LEDGVINWIITCIIARKIHSEYATSTYDDYSVQVTKLSGLYADLAKEAFRPCESVMMKMSPAK
jgi:hypothetical protein